MVIYHSAIGGLVLSVVMSTLCVIMVAAVKKCRGKCVPVFSHSTLMTPKLLISIPGKQTASEVGAAVKIPMQTNTAYESHQLSSRHPPPQMESCAAYGVMGRHIQQSCSLSSHV